MKLLFLAGSISAFSDYVCEQDWQGKAAQVISCPGGRINLTKAIYGRENSDKETCCKRYSKCQGKRDGTQCYADALDSLSEKCNGESECTIYGNLNGILGDPCKKNHKYLKYEYECDYSQPNLEVSFCETEVANRTTSFSCSAGTQIVIDKAIWGREKNQFCCPTKQERNCLSDNCSDSFDATELMTGKCGGKSTCTWDKSELALTDPCPNTFKYMTVNYRCEAPVLNSDASEMNFVYSAPSKTGEACGDLLSISKARLVHAMNVISSKDQTIHRGWFGTLKKQSDGKARNKIFPKNYERIGRHLTEDCECPTDAVSELEGGDFTNVWNEYERIVQVMTNVADDIKLKCEKASDRLTKKLTHAQKYLTKGTKRKAHLKEHYKAKL